MKKSTVIGVLAVSGVLAATGCRHTTERVDRRAEPPLLTVVWPEGVTTDSIRLIYLDDRAVVVSPMPQK